MAIGAGTQLIGVPPPSKQPSAAKPSGGAPVIQPNLGLFLNQPSWTLPPRSLEDCLNIRIRQGNITSAQMGWTLWASQKLNAAVGMVNEFIKSDGTRFLIAGTIHDLYYWNTGSSKFLFITPTYITGTVAASGTAVTGTGTAWATNASVGDEIAFGSTTKNDPTGTWYTIDTVTDDTHLVLHTSAGTVAGGTSYTLRRKFAGTKLEDAWHAETFPNADVAGDGSVFADLWYATNNGKNYPVSWDGDDQTVTVHSAFAFKCLNIKRFKNMMLYLNVTFDTGTLALLSFVNSDVGRPNTVVAAPGNLAGQFIVSPDTSPIQLAELLGDDLMVYTSRSVVDVSFVGSPNIFAFRTAIPRKGSVGDRTVFAFPDFHHFLAPDGLYWFNGVQATPIDMQVWRGLNSLFDPARINNSFVVQDAQYGDLLWGITLLGDNGTGVDGPPDFAYVAHYLEAPGNVDQPYLFSVHQLPYTKRNFNFCSATSYISAAPTTDAWNADANAWTTDPNPWNSAATIEGFPIVVVGGNDGYVYILNGADTQNGVGYPSFALFPRRPVTDLRHRSLVRRIYPLGHQLGTGIYPLNVTLYMYEQAQSVTPASSTSMPFDISLLGNHFVAPYRRGRFAQVKFGTDGSTTGQPWDLAGYDWDVVPGGMR